MINLGLIQTAMITPFSEDLEVDFNETSSLVEYLIANGTDTIIVAGTTGESPVLTHEEKLMLFHHVKNVAGDRAKVIANVGSNSTKESIEFAKEVEYQGKADGIMLVTPYYNKPSNEGLYQHFKAIADSTKLPIMLYNIPGRTGINLNAETVIELAKIPNIIAVKESSGNLNQMSTIIEHTADDFQVYSGDDNLTLPILSIGGNGVVSVASHIVGNEMRDMMTSFLLGDVVHAAQLHRKLLPIFEGIFFTTNPVPVKCLMRYLGFNVGSVRLPLVDVSVADEEKIQNLMQHLSSFQLQR